MCEQPEFDQTAIPNKEPSELIGFRETLLAKLNGIGIHAVNTQGEIYTHPIEWQINYFPQRDCLSIEILGMLPEELELNQRIFYPSGAESINYSREQQLSNERMLDNSKNYKLGFLMPVDKILCIHANLEIDKAEPRLLFTSFYDHRGFTVGQGITTKFYKGLHKAAQAFNLEAIFGNNNSYNFSYFTEKLGRKLLKDIPTELRDRIKRLIGGSGKYTTVQILK